MKQLEWQDRNTFPHDVCTARNEVTGGWMDSYDISRMDNGEFRVSGLMPHRPGEFSRSLEEARAIAEDDYQRRQRALAWREYMETHDVPGLGEQP